MPPQLILASTSPYRKALLAQLGLPFTTARPDVDETPQTGEKVGDLVRRLGEAKARAVAGRFPGAIVIGSDQAAVLDGALLGKPGTHEQAVDQLSRASGRSVVFYTSLCVLNTATDRCQVEVVAYEVFFRQLSCAQIERYLRREQPYDCAGAFKAEGLGIALFEKQVGDDPTALIGLPLMRLVTLLSREGIEVL